MKMFYRHVANIVTLATVVLLVLLLVWTSYQIGLVVSGRTPSFAQAGSHYWELTK